MWITRKNILKMIKLALVGKNISHSKSPEIYSQFLGEELIYTLLDYQSPKEIPSAEKLLNQFDGISITSPYKEHFIREINLVEDAANLQAVNCLRKSQDNKIEGVNTDYLAVVVILNELFQLYGELEVLVLGDGVMSRVLQFALRQLKKKYNVISRKLNPKFSNINLPDFLDQNKILVINTCSREFVYSKELNKNIIFWDFNYNFSPHCDLFKDKCIYIDGLSLLTLQAEFAIQFWSINKKI